MKLFNIALFGMICSTALSSSAAEEYQEPTMDLWCPSQDMILRIPSSEFHANWEKYSLYCDKEWFAAHRTDKPSNKQ